MKEIEDRKREDAYRRQELNAKLMRAVHYPEDVGVVYGAFRDQVDSGSRMQYIEGTGMVEEKE